jgi:hypothetical protein
VVPWLVLGLLLETSGLDPEAARGQEKPIPPDTPVRDLPSPAPEATAAPGTPPDFEGSWTGSMKLVNAWAAAPCRYEGKSQPPSLTLELKAGVSSVTGVVALKVPGARGCPALDKRYTLEGVQVSASGVSFVDPVGQRWDLGFKQGRLVGLVAWQPGVGRDEPLAAGFQDPSGQLPLTRLSGEVALIRAATGEAAKHHGGPAVGAGAFIVGAAVGAGVFLGTTRLVQDNNSGLSTSSCSPRSCQVGLPGQGCLCINNSNIVTGGSCGTVAGGVAFGGACSIPTRPCMSGLSCNGGICQDRSGDCPF